MSIVNVILIFIAVLGVLIFVHELGHFLFAKYFGVGVQKFSLGFGPKIIGKKVGETEYLISAFPLGGYVKMLGESPDDEIDAKERDRSFSNQPPLKKMAIVFAGPAFNIIFTVILYSFINMFGVQVLSPVVGYIEKGSPAYHGGIKVGDEIVKLNGTGVDEWGDMDSFISEKAGEKVTITILRDNREMVVEVVPEKKEGRNIFQEPVEVGSIGIWPFISTAIGEVMKGSPAESGGIKSGDKIVAIDGVEVGQWSEIVGKIQENAGREILVKVEREGETVELKVTPDAHTESLSDGTEQTVGRIGISSGEPDRRNLITKRHNPVTAIIMGAEQTWNIVKLTMIILKKLILGDIAANNIAGPIGIAQMTGQVAERGFTSLLFFMALLSINLGILNLLPIPILDGGHIVFFAFEAIIGKPISEKKMEIAQKVGIMLLVLLMVFAFYNDIVRLLDG